jgi:hypothetical protein
MKARGTTQDRNQRQTREFLWERLAYQVCIVGPGGFRVMESYILVCLAHSSSARHLCYSLATAFAVSPTAT